MKEEFKIGDKVVRNFGMNKGVMTGTVVKITDIETYGYKNK